MNNAQLLKDARAISAIAAREAKVHFRSELAVDFKQDESPVTVADRSIELAVRDYISKKYPTHGVLGEEGGSQRLDQDDVWVIDPIDGTRSFISGQPLFGFLLGCLHKSTPQIGLVGMPMLDEVFCGVAGEGATLNGVPIHVSKQTSLSQSIVYINEADKIFTYEPEVFGRLMQAGKTRRMAYDCYSYALLSAGYIDAVVDFDLQPYDFLPLMPLIEGAGGIITDWDGNSLTMGYSGAVIAAATKELHAELVETVVRSTK